MITEILLAVLIIVIVVFGLYYFFRGSSGRISLARPIESRVDEYLDRRFEEMVNEWDLVGRTGLNRFRDEKSPMIAADEVKLGELQKFSQGIHSNLNDLEMRLDALEKDLGRTGTDQS